jgi:anti-sigma factor RsiW
MTNSRDTIGHPTDEQLAAFLDGRLAGLQRDQMLAHLAACPACRSDTTAARRAMAGPLPGWRAWVRPTVTLVAAVAAFAIVPRYFNAAPSTAERSPTPRGQPDLMPRITVVTPADRAVLGDSGGALRWRSAGADATYHVALQDGAGRLVWETTVGDTAVAIPSDVSLEKGQPYFWSVDARLADGRTAASGAHRFLVR